MTKLDPVCLTGFFPWQPSQQSPQQTRKAAESFSVVGGQAIVVWSYSGCVGPPQWCSHGIPGGAGDS